MVGNWEVNFWFPVVHEIAHDSGLGLEVPKPKINGL
jgi:hypothetical protein